MAIPIKPTPNPVFAPTKASTGGVLGGAQPSGASKVFGTKPTIRPKTGQAAKKVDNSPLGAALSFGQSLIDVISTPLYYVDGAISGFQEISKKASSGQPLTGEDFAKPSVKAAQNALAWTRGERVVTGKDILKSAGMSDDFWSSLAADILLDPLNYIPGVIFTAPLKAAGIAAKTGIKATKAASTGAISAKVAAKTAEIAPEAIKPLRPGATLLTQYSRKPLIKQNLMVKGSTTLAERQEKITKLIGEKFTYKVVDPTVTGPTGKAVAASDVIASGVEAAYKAAGATYMAEYAKKGLFKNYGLETIARKDVKTAKKAELGLKGIRSATAEAERVLSDIPEITDNGVQKTLEPFTPHKTPDGTIVLDNEKIIHTFKNEKEASSWITEKTGAPAKAATVGPRPIMDTVPVSEADRTLGSTPITGFNAKTAEKMLKTVTKLVTSAKGVSTAQNAGEAVRTILTKQRELGELAAMIRPEVRTLLEYVVKGEEDPFALLKRFGKEAATSQKGSILRKLATARITNASGETVTILSMLKDGTSFKKLPKPEQTQVLNAFKTLLASGAESATKTMGDITTIVGDKVAKEIAGAKDQLAVQKILAKLPKGGVIAEKTYANFDEFVAGLRNKDQVDFSVLEKILKALDPENDLLTQIAKGLDKPTAYAQISTILIAKGPQTIAETERRIALVQPDVLYKSQGLAYSDAAASYAAGRINGDIEVSPESFYESRQKAGANLAARYGSETGGSKVNRTILSIAKGLGQNFEYINDIINSPSVVEELSSLDDLYVRNTSAAYRAETKAALLKQINQSGEAKILGNMFGLIRNDVGAKLKKSGVTRPPTPKELQDEFLVRAPIMHDVLLAVMGSRIRYNKNAKVAKGEKHYIYSSIGDFAEILSRTDKGSSILQRALFPDVAKAGIEKTDALSTIAIGQTIRMLLEAKELGKLNDMEDVVAMLKTRGELQAPWSATFESRVDKIARDLANYITDPKIIKSFEEVHLARANAAVDDVLTSVDNLTEDAYSLLMKGHLANIDKNMDSVTARADLVRDLFVKFAYAAGIFDQQSGQQAQAVFMAAAHMFIANGRLAKLSPEMKDLPSLVGSPTARKPEEQELFADMVAAINSYFKTQGSPAFAGAGRERLPFPTETAIANATTKLQEAKGALDVHIKAGVGLTSKAAVNKWNKDLVKLQTKLDDARLVAWKNNVPTEHRLPDGSWVSSTVYNAEKAAAMAAEMADDVVLTAEGTARKASVVDKKPSYPSHKALTAEESKKWMAKWRKENKVRSLTAAQGASQDAAKKTLDRLKEFENIGLSLAEQAQRLKQNQTNEVFQDAQMLVYKASTTYERGFAQFSEKFSGTGGRSTVKPLLNRAESTLVQGISTVGDYAHYLRDSYKNVWTPDVRVERFTEAFRYGVSRTAVPRGTDKTVAALANDLQNMLDPIFGKPGMSVLKDLDRESVIAAFAKYGLSQELGFINPRDLTQDQFEDYLSWLPFADTPASIVNTADEKLFKARGDLFKETGMDPFVAITRMAQAIQFAKTEKTLVMDFSVNFSYKAHGLTLNEAVAQGWVKIEGKSAGGTDFSAYLPSPEDGGLFPPDIAAEFMSMNREWNKLYNDKAMPKFIKNAMEIVGLFKATQTILRPGHHVTNAVGDITTAILAGTRNPIHWRQGLEIARKFADEDLAATWGKDKLSGKFSNLMEAYKGYGRAFEGTDDVGRTVPAITLYTKNGTAKKFNLSYDDLYRAFQERGIVIGNIFQNDIQGLYDSMIATPGAIGKKKELDEVIMSKIRETAGVVTNPAGSFAAHYGNVPRAAHAMQVIQSRSWNSIDEALNAASLEVTRYHPTVQSLAASERKYPRIAFTYYTWLRVAHNALIDMALNHTVAMAIPFKIQYQQSREAGFEPLSIGTPWEDKNLTPNYLNYSVYGPTATGPKGPILYKRSILPMDVLDTWNFTYDPAYTMDQNAFKSIASAGRVVGKSTNLLAQPIIENITGTDLTTGRPSQVTDIQSVGEKMLNSIGTVGLLKGLGVYTPSNKGPTSTDPYDAYTRNMLLQNWFSGQKAQVTDTNANIKNAQTQQAARNKAYMERLLKEQEAK